MKQKSPSIGIVVCARERGRVFTSLPYIQVIADHCGLPFSIPFFEDASDAFFLSCQKKFDGFLFCGGGDINPLLSHAFPSEYLENTDYDFDLFQLRFLTFLLKHSKKPILGICKGMQVLNIACRGTLYQDLSENPEFFHHNQSSFCRHQPSHLIRAEESSLIRKILGESASVNSFHHQGILQPGTILTPTAYSPDGLIEAVEGKEHPFLLGVQWHPECMYLHSRKMSRLFEAFLNACS